MSERKAKQSMTFRFSRQEASEMKATASSWADALRDALDSWHQDVEGSNYENFFLDPSAEEKLKPYTLRMPDRLKDLIERASRETGMTKAQVVRQVWKEYGRA